MILTVERTREYEVRRRGAAAAAAASPTLLSPEKSPQIRVKHFPRRYPVMRPSVVDNTEPSLPAIYYQPQLI